jgi:predicted amidohydrolase
MIQVAAHQLAPTIADLSANEEMSIAAVRRSVADGGQLIVMPELALSGYMLNSPEELRSVAITADHSVFAAWSALIAEIDGVVIGGFAELDDGFVYNSVAVVDRSGVLAVYRKTHLWDKEKLIFTPGALAPPVVETPLGRLGVLICYDLEFPEMTRSLALRGAELIVIPTNWPLESVPAGERPPEITIAMAAAHGNHVAIVCCDRSGTERGQAWNCGTSIINEQGWIIAATADVDGTAVAELDLHLSRDKTISPLSDAFEDRRPELYGAIGAPRGAHGVPALAAV